MPRPTNTRFALGVHMLTLLGGATEPVSSEVLAGSAGSNPVHARRVLARLRTARLVESKPGVGGGWQLAADPAAITLADVWRAVQGQDPLLGLHDANPACAVGQRIQHALSDVNRRAAAAIESELELTTIQELEHDTLAHELERAG